MRTLIFSLAVVALLGQRPAMAAPDYRCIVERVHNAAGEAASSLVHHERKIWTGKEFSIDRQTGVMTGALKNSFISKPSVIDSGSSENSFKAVATLRKEQSTGGGSAVFTLVVNEYIDSPVKPFVFLANDIVYFGSCKHDK